MEIIKGKVKVPAKIILYGPPGVGKTTFISQLDEVLIADTERGSHGIDCARIEIKSAKVMYDAIKWFKDEKDYKTLVIDSYSRIQQFLSDDLLAEKQWKDLEAPGYGKGYEILKQRIINFVKACEWLNQNGKNIVVVCHQRIKPFNDPTMDAYDRFEPDILKQALPDVIASFDAVLFYRKKTMLREKGDKSIAHSTQDRELYSSDKASFVAKNRFGFQDVTVNPNPKEYFKDVF